MTSRLAAPSARIAALLALSPGAALAHGFGQRYDLPLPLWLYLTGAGLTVLLSFVILALRRARVGKTVRGIDMTHTTLGRVLTAPLLRKVLRVLVLAVYVLVILAGLFGVQNPVKNIAPAMVWAIWWVGMAYLSALLGDVWAQLNPLDSAYRWGALLLHRLRGGPARPRRRHYPEGAGVWPAVVLYLLFIWMELVWDGGEQPAKLAWAMLLYSALSWLGMALFGRTVWLHRGEVFAIVFSLLARFAPNQVHNTHWRLRPFAVGLLAETPVEVSRIVLVIVMLASVSFDGLIETQPWFDLLAWLSAQWPDAMALPYAVAGVKTLALLLLPALFLLIFLGCCRLIARGAGTAGRRAGPVISTQRVAGMFVLTLIPIAIAYHFAHYLSFLVMAAQYLIPLASDPFGLGWNLFGTRLYFVRLGVVDARMVWYLSLFAIVAGHVAAVYLAHVTALRQFGRRRAALRSQLPMLALMVGYTMVSLWILAQPIVNG